MDIRLLGSWRADGKQLHRIETTDGLPVPESANKDVIIILDAERRALYDEAKRVYPGAEFSEIRPPFGGPAVVYYVRLSTSDIRSVQGLTGRYLLWRRLVHRT